MTQFSYFTNTTCQGRLANFKYRLSFLYKINSNLKHITQTLAFLHFLLIYDLVLLCWWLRSFNFSILASLHLERTKLTKFCPPPLRDTLGQWFPIYFLTYHFIRWKSLIYHQEWGMGEGQPGVCKSKNNKLI